MLVLGFRPKHAPATSRFYSVFEMFFEKMYALKLCCRHSSESLKLLNLKLPRQPEQDDDGRDLEARPMSIAPKT